MSPAQRIRPMTRSPGTCGSTLCTSGRGAGQPISPAGGPCGDISKCCRFDISFESRGRPVRVFSHHQDTKGTKKTFLTTKEDFLDSQQGLLCVFAFLGGEVDLLCVLGV